MLIKNFKKSEESERLYQMPISFDSSNHSWKKLVQCKNENEFEDVTRNFLKTSWSDAMHFPLNSDRGKNILHIYMAFLSLLSDLC